MIKNFLIILVENILYKEVSHSHIVFTIPKMLRLYFKYDRSLMKYLYWSAWESLKALSLSGNNGEGECGAIMSLHTSGSLLNFHPHIHALFLNGVVMPDGRVEELELLSKEKLESLFSSKLFCYLKEEGVLDSERIANMNSWEHSGFNVWIGEGKMVKKIFCSWQDI